MFEVEHGRLWEIEKDFVKAMEIKSVDNVWEPDKAMDHVRLYSRWTIEEELNYHFEKYE